jgi:flagellar hook-associated protein 1
MAHEGVNLDEELVLMTTYQQAFNASARLIQAAKDMYDTLMGMVR